MRKFLNRGVLGCLMLWLSMAVCTAALTGCGFDGHPKSKHVETTAQQEAPLAANTTSAAFSLSPGDILKINVFGDADFSNEYEINRSGLITMPLIGDLKAAGLSVTTLQNVIAQKLQEGQYLVDPRVSVEVVSFQPFYILGEVRTPGSYPYHPSLDTFKAIALAGGLTPRARKGDYVIIRDNGVEKIEIDADDQTPILPGDSIRVKERFF